jgi:site-specific DNA-cytosine methylase
MRPAYPGELVERPAPTVSSTRGGRGGKGSDWAVDMLEQNPDRVSGTKNRRTLTVEEVGILQDFPADWPWQGKKRDRYRQAGNACPEKLTRAVVAAALDMENPP